MLDKQRALQQETGETGESETGHPEGGHLPVPGKPGGLPPEDALALQGKPEMQMLP